MQMTLPNYATRFDSLSLAACFLNLKGIGDTSRHATGFFWRRGQKIYLVTNSHVVTGINLFDGNSMGSGWCPERLCIEFFTKAMPAGPDGLRHLNIPRIEVLLYEDFHSPLWLQHPMTLEWNVDIVAIEIEDVKEREEIFCVNGFTYPSLYHFAAVRYSC
jgi:hypothetical protein